MTCRYCNLFHFKNDSANLVILEHDRSWQWTVLCDNCLNNLESDQYSNRIRVIVEAA